MALVHHWHLVSQGLSPTPSHRIRIAPHRIAHRGIFAVYRIPLGRLRPRHIVPFLADEHVTAERRADRRPEIRLDLLIDRTHRVRRVIAACFFLVAARSFFFLAVHGHVYRHAVSSKPMDQSAAGKLVDRDRF